MIRAKHGPDKFLIYQPTSHTYMPYVILKHNHNVEIRCGDIGFKYKLEQLPKLF